ncbi:MAG TPA: TrmH family RNA methyltransferase [Clostridiales bacterium]|nr:TrmH family RNA methyltransferase [Clostridiales bacterium]
MAVKRYKKEDIVTYCLGATVSMEYLNIRPEVVSQVYLHSAFYESETKEKILKICKERHIPCDVNDKVFQILSQKENCFVIAMIRKYNSELDREASHVVLVNPGNSGNAGTIIRSATGFGVTNIAIIRPGVDFFDPKVIRASMGALSRVKFKYYDSWEDYEKTDGAGNRHFYPFMLDGSTLLHETKIEKPFSLIMGNEATGLPASFAKVGCPVRIEHTKNIDSLNLPIATSIGLYEATKGDFGE